MRMLLDGNYNEEFPLNGTISKKLLTHFSQTEKTIDNKLKNFGLLPAKKKYCNSFIKGIVIKVLLAYVTLVLILLTNM